MLKLKHISFDQFVAAVSTLGPVLLPMVGVPGALTPIVTHAMIAAQQLKNATGPEKLSHALEVITDSAQGLNVAAGHEVVNVTQLQGVITKGIETTLDGVRLVHSIPVTQLPAAPPTR